MSKKSRRLKPSGPKDSPPPQTSTFQPLPWSREDRGWLAALLGLSGAVYWGTMWPSIAGGDSGELTAAACSLGIVHPPGYPLYTMIGHLFSLIPIGSPAWRLNLLSMVCGITALALLFLTIRRLTRTAWLAFSSVGLIAFSPLMWRYSIAAEVFALNNLFTAALLYGLARAVQDSKSKYVYVLSFLFGLGLSNHHTLLFVGAPIGLYLLYYFREQFFRPSRLLAVLALFFLGMLPYAYLFWASERIPIIAWGDITSWSGFMTHLLRKEYGTFSLATEGSSQLQLFWGLFYYVLNLGQSLGYLGLIAAIFGSWRIMKGKSEFTPIGGRLWLLVPALYLLVFHSLANLPFVSGAALYRDIVSRFWLMPNLIFAVIAASGFLHLLHHTSASQAKALKIVALIAPALAILIHFKHENHRDNTTFTDFGKYLLDHLPPNALFFSLGDINTNAVRYLQACESYRRDVKILDRSLMSYSWFKRIVTTHHRDVILPGSAYHPTQSGGYDFKRLFDANYHRHPIYMTTIKTKDSNEAADKAWESQYTMLPYGLALRVRGKDEPFNIDEYIQESAAALVDPIQAFPRKPLADSWDAVIQANYWLAHHTRAAEILRYALKTQKKKYFSVAEVLLEELVARNPAPPADYFKNLGIAHQHLGRLSQGDVRRKHEIRMLEVWEVFVQKTDRKDKTLEDIRSVLRAYGRSA